jgi:hypothetical protein
MVTFNADGSGTITAPNGAVQAFSAGIMPSDLLAMVTSWNAVNALPPTATPVTLTPTVTVTAGDIARQQTHLAQVFTYLPQLVTAISKIPSAGVIPPAPVAVA